jgi:hypothetical protein
MKWGLRTGIIYWLTKRRRGRIHLATWVRAYNPKLLELAFRMDIHTATISGGGGGSRTRVRKCYWSRDYMLIPVHAPGVGRHCWRFPRDVRGPRSERTRNASR